MTIAAASRIRLVRKVFLPCLLFVTEVCHRHAPIPTPADAAQAASASLAAPTPDSCRHATSSA